MRRGLLIVLSFCVVAGSAGRDNDVYQLLREDSTDFKSVLPGKTLEFPRDHLAHPGYRIEWWYLTANLSDSSGRDWGVHWTLFRQALNADGNSQGWTSNQVWMAHAALSAPDGHVYQQRFARGGIGQAGAAISDGRFDAWLDDWQLLGDGAEPLPGTLTFKLDDYTAELRLNANTPWVLHGDRGYSRKSTQGQASYYYSQPHIQVSGVIKTADRQIKVNGPGWMDREWSSQPLAENQSGWDWFSLHLQDGSALMVFRLRHDDRGESSPSAGRTGKDWISGTWIGADGHSEALTADKIVLRPLELRSVRRQLQEPIDMPLAWSLVLPGRGAEYRWIIRAPDPDHWLETFFPYWEGPVVAEGVNPGVGYLEMTGY